MWEGLTIIRLFVIAGLGGNTEEQGLPTNTAEEHYSSGVKQDSSSHSNRSSQICCLINVEQHPLSIDFNSKEEHDTLPDSSVVLLPDEHDSTDSSTHSSYRESECLLKI